MVNQDQHAYPPVEDRSQDGPLPTLHRQSYTDTGAAAGVSRMECAMIRTI